MLLLSESVEGEVPLMLVEEDVQLIKERGSQVIPHSGIEFLRT